ncbi:MAG: acylphosphatase [Thermoprotei archaeon]|nr:MAG: acylphosphatase [Thermoprotei archaeon]RLE99188.1 MAG: acylphosphatase [Thermoprotei archaeon]
MAKMVRAHLFISGIVQGVFFRANMRRVARMYGVKGWVKNLPDGRVEAVLEGPEDAVKKVIKWAHRGPPLARVDKVDVEWEEYRGEFDDFEVRYW